MFLFLIVAIILMILIILRIKSIMYTNKNMLKETFNMYTKKDILSRILEEKREIIVVNEIVEGYNYKDKTVTIKNEESKEVKDILVVVDIVASMYDNTLQLEERLSKIFLYLSIILFIVYYVITVGKVEILFVISLLLIGVHIIIKYFIYLKNIKIRKNIIFRKFKFTDEEKEVLLSGGKELDLILRVIEITTLVLILVLFRFYILS